MDSPVRLCWDPGALLRLSEHVNPGCTGLVVCVMCVIAGSKSGEREKLVGREQQRTLAAP